MRGLAERSGVSVSVISRAEGEKRAPPKATTIRKLAEALSLSSEETEDLLIVSGRLMPVTAGDDSQIVRRLTVLEDRVLRLEELLERHGGVQG